MQNVLLFYSYKLVIINISITSHILIIHILIIYFYKILQKTSSICDT